MSEDAAQAHATLEALKSAANLTGSLRCKIAESISTLTQIDEDLAAIGATVQAERLKLVKVIGMYPNPFNAPQATAKHPPPSPGIEHQHPPPSSGIERQHPPPSSDIERKPARGVSTPPLSEGKPARGISAPLSNPSTPRQDKRGTRKNVAPKKPGAASLKKKSKEESPKPPTETSPKRPLYTSDEESPKHPTKISDEPDRGPGPSKRAKPSTFVSVSAKTPGILEGMEE